MLLQSSTAVANARYRRSQSTGAERWVDHHAANEVPLNTILKPSLKGSKRSVTRLSEKEIFHEKTSKYCLTTQEQDTDGEVETKLFKVYWHYTGVPVSIPLPGPPLHDSPAVLTRLSVLPKFG